MENKIGADPDMLFGLQSDVLARLRTALKKGDRTFPLALKAFLKMPAQERNAYFNIAETEAERKFWKTLTIGGKTAEQLITEIEQNYKLSDYAKAMLKHKNFTTLPQEENIDLAVITPRDLGFTSSPTFSQWIAALKEHAVYDICPAEVGPYARLAYPDQKKGEWIGVAMETIPGPDGRPGVFYVVHDDGGQWLHGLWYDPGGELDLDDLWFVRVRK